MNRIKGRGAASNREGRFESVRREAVDDGWFPEHDENPARPATTVTEERARSIISRNASPDIPFDQSINPYRGCEHGCVYCYARPSHAYLNLSPGLDFETRLFVKDGAAELLERELSAPGYQPRTIAIGSNTDPYQPIERTHRVMRSILEVLSRANHPVGIVTKSALVLRDLDLLAPMAEKGLVKVALSVTSLDGKLARAMEPRAAQPARRLEALRELSMAGVPTTVMVAPIIPALNDHEMEAVLSAAAGHGARSAGYVLLRLPLEIKDLFREWLDVNVPTRAKHVMALVRQMRGGKDYDANWNTRMKGAGPYAQIMARRFHMAVKRLELNRAGAPLAVHKFKRPARLGDQLALF
jgi:DNA repair photolyase